MIFKYRHIITLLVAALLVTCFDACKSAEQIAKKQLKQDEQNIDKAFVRNPAMVAGKTRIWFPCTPVKSSVDSAALIEWLRNQEQAISDFLPEDEERPRDTVVDVWEDSTKIKFLTKQNDSLANVLSKCTGTIRSLQSAIKNVPAVRDTVWMKDSAEVKMVEAVCATVVSVKEKKIVDLEKDLAKHRKYKFLFMGLAAPTLIGIVAGIFWLIGRIKRKKKE